MRPEPGGTDLDRFAADPHWHGWIVAYFFLGGVAAGAYALGALASLFGDEADRRTTRVADYLAFPLVNLCGLILVVDLGRPERFWHMLVQSETWRPMFKWWSPMSVGSWGLSLFGAFSAASFLGVAIEDGWLGSPTWRARVTAWRRGWPGVGVAAGGAASAFFLGSYTGVLLSATNQPIWAETTWIAPLFLASSASTGGAAIVLLARPRLRDVDRHALDRVERLDTWAIALEIVLLVALAISLGKRARPAFGVAPGAWIPWFVVPVGLVLPLGLRRAGGRGAEVSAGLVLAGGLVLRAAIVGIPIPHLIHPH